MNREEVLGSGGSACPQGARPGVTPTNGEIVVAWHGKGWLGQVRDRRAGGGSGMAW